MTNQYLYMYRFQVPTVHLPEHFFRTSELPNKFLGSCSIDPESNRPETNLIN